MDFSSPAPNTVLIVLSEMTTVSKITSESLVMIPALVPVLSMVKKKFCIVKFLINNTPSLTFANQLALEPSKIVLSGETPTKIIPVGTVRLTFPSPW